MRSLKILAFGDSVKMSTGYGRVSLNVLGYFALRGHQVIQIAGGRMEPPETIPIMNASDGHTSGITIVPGSMGDYHYWTVMAEQYINTWHPDLVYNSNDFFTSEDIIGKNLKMFFCNYGVIDGPGCANAYRHIIEKINVPVTPSMYGLKQIQEITDNGIYIPHGVNTNIFNKYTIDKEKQKEKFGLQGKFIYGCANRNIWRKQYPNIIKAFATLKYKYNINDIGLFFVCDPMDLQGNNLFNWAKYFNLTISNNPAQPADIMLHPRLFSVIYPISDQDLAEAYNAFDVMVSASMSEGFGLTTLESMACGVPPIICDNSANTELAKDHGWLYPPVKGADGESILVPPTLKDITYGYEQPDYGAMTFKMLEAYNNKNLVHMYGDASLKFARTYDWSVVLPRWEEVLQRANDAK